MTEQPRTRRRGRRVAAAGVVALVVLAVGLGGWVWYVWDKQRQRAEVHRGLDGVWVDDTGRDVSYQFREGGEFRVRQKVPGTLAPFTGDPGVEHRPAGSWQRAGPSVSVRTERNWGFELMLGDDGVLRGEYVLDQWSGEGKHSQTRTPVVLARKPDAP